jgi:hypothetical protein
MKQSACCKENQRFFANLLISAFVFAHSSFAQVTTPKDAFSNSATLSTAPHSTNSAGSNSLERVVAGLSRGGEERCSYKDSSSCGHCSNALTFLLCVKDAAESIDLMKSGEAMVQPMKAAKPLLQQTQKTLQAFTINQTAMKDKAKSLTATAATSLTALGVPQHLVAPVVDALKFIQLNGRLPVPQLAGPGKIPEILSAKQLFDRAKLDVEARIAAELAAKPLNQTNTNSAPTSANKPSDSRSPDGHANGASTTPAHDSDVEGRSTP